MCLLYTGQGSFPGRFARSWTWQAARIGTCQISVDSKSNEIPAVQEQLQILNLKGAVVTAERAAQKRIVRKDKQLLWKIHGQHTLR